MKLRFSYVLHGIILTGFLISGSLLHGQLIINEVSSQNASINLPDTDEHLDWIELYNTGNNILELSGYFISDQLSSPFAFQFPENENLIVPPDGYLLLYACGCSTCDNCLPFKISSSGEFLQVLAPDSSFVDSLTIPPLIADVSYGRFESSWLYYTPTSPGTQNTDQGFLGILNKVEFSESSRLLNEGIELAISHSEPEVDIRYIIGGDLPDQNSPIYTLPLSIDSTSIIRCIALKENFIPSPVHGVDLIFHESNLDVISISASSTDLFGISGIYDNYTLDEEVQAFFSFIDQSQLNSYESAAGLELHSPDSEDQKSLRLSAKSVFGANKFQYPFFSSREIAEFESLILRNAGEDGLEFQGSGMRDALTHRTYQVESPEVAFSASELVEVFLNGSYWGIYNLRERQDPSYIDSYYTDLPVDFLERTSQYPSTEYIIEGTWEDYNLLDNTISELDLSDDQNYAFISDWMNVDDFIDNQLIEIFVCNQDWLSNNMKFWRPQNESNKWRWMLWDTDWGLGTWYPDYPSGYASWNALNFALSDWGGWTEEVETEFLQNLTQNESFKNSFSSRAADLRNTSFHEDSWNSLIDFQSEQMLPQIQEHFARWEGDSLEWANEMQLIRDFVNERGDYFLEHFRDQFDLGAIHQVTWTCVPENAAQLEVNTVFPGQFPWLGDYFDSIPVRSFPHAQPGFLFSHWEDDIELEQERIIDLSSDTILTAHFVAYSNNSEPIINEIMYAPSSGQSELEWVELANAGSDTIFLHGYVLTDGNEPFIFSEGSVLLPNGFLVLCEDTSAFHGVHPDVDVIEGPLTFRLSNEGEAIWMEDYNGNTVDEVIYMLDSPWPSDAYQTGKSIELESTELDNSLGGNWFSDLLLGGSPGAMNDHDVGVAIYPNPETPFSLAPNPGNGNFCVVFRSIDSGNYELQLLNNKGQLVWAEKLSSGYAQKIEHCVDLLDKLSVGSYLVKLIDLQSGWEESEILIVR